MGDGFNARLSGPAGISLALHLTLVALVVLSFRKGPPEVLPPVYRVNIVAAPAGPRAIGTVQPEPVIPDPVKPAVAPPAPEVTKEKAVPIAKATPKKTAAKATPNDPAKPVPPAPAPRAGGGPIGGKGTDV